MRQSKLLDLDMSLNCPERHKMTFGQFIRRKRRSLEMSQETVANALGFTHRSQVHKLETSAIEWKLSHLFQLAKLFNVRPDELIREFDENQ